MDTSNEDNAYRKADSTEDDNIEPNLMELMALVKKGNEITVAQSSSAEQQEALYNKESNKLFTEAINHYFGYMPTLASAHNLTGNDGYKTRICRFWFKGGNIRLIFYLTYVKGGSKFDRLEICYDGIHSKRSGYSDDSYRHFDFYKNAQGRGVDGSYIYQVGGDKDSRDYAETFSKVFKLSAKDTLFVARNLMNALQGHIQKVKCRLLLITGHVGLAE